MIIIGILAVIAFFVGVFVVGAALIAFAIDKIGGKHE